MFAPQPPTAVPSFKGNVKGISLPKCHECGSSNVVAIEISGGEITKYAKCQTHMRDDRLHIPLMLTPGQRGQ